MRPAQMTAQSLPAELLQRILQHLSVKERLGSAALVHSAWHLAAVAATSSIALTIPSQHTINQRQQQLDRFLAWVQRYGDRVPQILTLKAPLESCDLATHHLQALCSTVLRDLSLIGISLQLAPDNTGWRQGALQSCYALTSLELRSCNLLSPAASMAALAAMTRLQRLCVAACAEVFTGPVVISSSFVRKLDHLTALRLEQPAVTAESFQQLSCLTRLRRFVLEFPVECMGSIHQVNRKPLAAAAPSALCLTPNLAQLIGLQHLALRDCQCDPAQLAPLLQLQSLDLCGTRCSNTAALLEWVSQLQHLTSLNVEGCLQLDGDAEPAPLTAYEALTASSGLECLACSVDALPTGVWQHMFPADKVFPRLRELRVWKWQAPMRDASGVRVAQQQQQQQRQTVNKQDPQLGDGDMWRLVQCCPQLQYLQLGACVQQEPSTTGMTLTCLTRLQQLELSLTWHGDNDRFLQAALHNKAPSGSPPDVWMQLHNHCARFKGEQVQQNPQHNEGDPMEVDSGEQQEEESQGETADEGDSEGACYTSSGSEDESGFAKEVSSDSSDPDWQPGSQ